MNFISTVQEILEEQGKTTKDLFNDKIVSKNTFYKYRQRNPSLSTLINIANYLKVSIDYLCEINDENNFHQYSLNQEGFYNNLISILKSANISCRKFSKDLNYSRENILRWKNGTRPSVQSIIEIAQYLNCSIDDLLNNL